MKVKLDEIKSAFDLVNVVPAELITESSQFVRITQRKRILTLALTGTIRAEAHASSDVDGDWVAYADRRAMAAFMATASGTDVDVVATDKKLTLRAGQRLEVAAHAEVPGYESWTPGKAEAMADWVPTALLAAKYLPATPGAEHVGAVALLQGVGVVATDTLFVMADQTAKPKRDIMIPSSLMGALSAESAISEANGATGLVTKIGWVCQPVSVDLERFPRARLCEIIDQAKKAKTQVRVAAAELHAAVSTASQFLFDKAEAIDVVPGKTESAIAVSVDTGTGAFTKALRVNGALKSSMVWSAKRLLPWLAAMAAQEKAVLEIAQLPGMFVLRCSPNHVLAFAEM